MATAAKISIAIEAQTASLQKGFDQAKGAIRDLDKSMSNHVAWGMTKFSVGMGIVRKAAGMASGAVHNIMAAIERMGTMDEAAQKLGMTADSLAALGYAAEQSGASQGELNSALEKMGRNLSAAASGGGPAVKALQKLGLSAKQLRSMDTDKQLETIAEKMYLVSKAGDKTRLMMDIFGKSGNSLSLMLANGKQGLEDYRREAAELGITLGEMRGQMEAAGDAMHSLEVAQEGLWNRLAIHFGPVLGDVSTKLAKLIGAASEAGIMGVKAPPKMVHPKRKRSAIDEILDRETNLKRQGIAPVTKASSEGFSAVHQAVRDEKAAAERKHKDIIGWMGKIHSAIQESAIVVEPVNV
jgi:hypothetical protein